MTSDPLAYLNDRLDQLAAEGLRRTPADPTPHGALSFCSNDYLGLASRPTPVAPAGSGASRLVAGERDEHRAFERGIAAWLGAEDALLFTSGYAANVGVVSALVGRGDLLVSDALNHASLIDGARLSRADVHVVPHLDLDAVEVALSRPRGPGAAAWLVVESYYSMDADGPDLARLRAICDRHGAGLLVDEAHALGVLGPAGRGRLPEAGVHADAVVGTLGKSFGGQGAFVAGRSIVRTWLWNRARSFVFSTGLAPASAAAGLDALARIQAAPDLGAQVLARASRLREGLRRVTAAHDPTLQVLGFGHVVPLLVGAPGRATALAAALQRRDVLVHAIRPPTVPSGTSRLRFTMTARHTDADVDRAVAAMAEALREVDATSETRGAT